MIYLASYTGTQKGWQGIFNIGIRKLTKSIYSHTEVCIGNPFDAPVKCVSSSGVDKGVRAKTMQLNPDKWDILPMDWVTEKDVEDFLAENEGTGYDFMGCARFVFPFALRDHPVKFFCTEAVATIAGYKDAWRFSPGDFHVIIEARKKR
jgi:hypothetical protein